MSETTTGRSTLEPTGARLVSRLEDRRDGLVLPQGFRPMQRIRVTAVGPAVSDGLKAVCADNGAECDVIIKEGSATQVVVDDVTYLIVDEKDVLAVVRSSAA